MYQRRLEEQVFKWFGPSKNPWFQAFGSLFYNPEDGKTDQLEAVYERFDKGLLQLQKKKFGACYTLWKQEIQGFGHTMCTNMIQYCGLLLIAPHKCVSFAPVDTEKGAKSGLAQLL
jgi:hypothetical protein